MDYSKLSDEELDQLVAQKLSQGQVDYNTLSDDQLTELVAQKLAGQSEQKNTGEAFVQGFGQSATLGYLPQIQAATEKGVSYLSSLIPGTAEYETEKLKEQGFQISEPTYTETRDAYAQRQQELQAQNPEAYGVGQLAGAITSTAGVGGAGAVKAGAKLAQAAKTGLAFGFLRNPGDEEGKISPLQLEQRLKNASVDAVFGVAGTGAIMGAGKLARELKNIPRTLKHYAELKSLKASGAMLKDFRKLLGNKKAFQLGREVLDSGLVAAGDDIADIAKKAEVARMATGEKISQIYDKADNVIGAKFDPDDVKKIIEGYAQEASERLQGRIDQDQIGQKMQDILSMIAENKNPTFRDLKVLRQSIDDQINYARNINDLPMYQGELSALRNKIQDAIKEKLGKVNPRLRSELIAANKKYSNLAEIAKMAKDKAAREEANAVFGLRERISGGAGAVIGGMIGGAPGAVAGGALGAITTKVARSYGSPLVARVADRAARMLEGGNIQALGEFAQPLLDAASQNPEAFVKMISKFNSDPEFKKRLYAN